MWLFTKQGFYSIVEDKDDPAYLMVRARVEGDIEKLFPEAKVSETPEADYLYRARVHRVTLHDRLVNVVENIDYDNFKHAVEDHDRRDMAYLWVWQSMVALQEGIVEDLLEPVTMETFDEIKSEDTSG